MLKKKSFFERLTGGMRMEENEEEENVETETKKSKSSQGSSKFSSSKNSASEKSTPLSVSFEDEQEGELTVDVYQTPNEIIIQSMVAGVKPENLSITITRDMVTIKGKREEPRGILEENYFIKELYWGTFSRTISLPQEIEPEITEAMEKHGLLVIKLPIVNKEKQTVLKVKSF